MILIGRRLSASALALDLVAVLAATSIMIAAFAAVAAAAFTTVTSSRPLIHIVSSISSLLRSGQT
jgi:hypothetical protein